MKSEMLASVVLVLSIVGSVISFAGEVNNDDVRPQWPDNRPDNRPGMGPRPGQQGQWSRNERMGGATTRPVSPDEIAEADAFMQKYSPRRYEKLQELPDARREKLMVFLAARYRMLQELKQNDPEIYEIRIARISVEDNIFDLGWQLNHDSPRNVDELKSKLDKQLRALYRSGIEERRVRLRQWKKRVEEEIAQIEKNEANMDRIVESSMNNLLNNEAWPGMMNLLGGGPGGSMGPGVGPGPGRGGMRPERDRPGRGPFAAPAPESTQPAEQ